MLRRSADSVFLSKTWKVARLTSAISSSPRKIRLALSCDGTIVGAVGDTPPVMAKDPPAAPNAKAVLLAVCLAARFVLAIVESPASSPQPRTSQGEFRLLGGNTQVFGLGETSPSAMSAASASCRWLSRVRVRRIDRHALHVADHPS